MTRYNPISLFIIALIFYPFHHAWPQPAGKLYVIGGGKRPPLMAQEMVKLAQLDQPNRYALVMTMATAEKKEDFDEVSKQLAQAGGQINIWFDVDNGNNISPSMSDSIARAALIFICGGDQNVFANIVRNTKTHQAIMQAYQQGALIAGTSAGASVQSLKMITGREKLKSEYDGRYRDIRANNIELDEGLGLLRQTIIDQHFIWRMRMNRLISIAIENPDQLLVGIDESTAILVQGDTATVRGLSQVVTLKAFEGKTRISNGLLGATDMKLNVYLPGERFSVHTGQPVPESTVADPRGTILIPTKKRKDNRQPR